MRSSRMTLHLLDECILWHHDAVTYQNRMRFHLFTMLSADKEKRTVTLDVDSDGRTMLTNFMNVLEYFP